MNVKNVAVPVHERKQAESEKLYANLFTPYFLQNF